MSNKPHQLTDLIGKRFGTLVVIAYAGLDRHSGSTWSVRCDCGKERVMARTNLRSAKSCGCLARALVAAARTTHGRHGTPEYRSWCSMKGRCENRSNKRFGDYGGRGICVCQSWRESFESFLADMGERPSLSHQLDRINNNGNYEPGNCRWATVSEQSRNRRSNIVVEIDGQRMPLLDACARIGAKYKLVWERMRRGLSFDEACRLPVSGTSRRKVA